MRVLPKNHNSNKVLHEEPFHEIRVPCEEPFVEKRVLHKEPQMILERFFTKNPLKLFKDSS